MPLRPQAHCLLCVSWLPPSMGKIWALGSSEVPKGMRSERDRQLCCGDKGPLTHEAGGQRLTGPRKSAPTSRVWGPSSSCDCVWAEPVLSLEVAERRVLLQGRAATLPKAKTWAPGPPRAPWAADPHPRPQFQEPWTRGEQRSSRIRPRSSDLRP